MTAPRKPVSTGGKRGSPSPRPRRAVAPVPLTRTLGRLVLGQAAQNAGGSIRNLVAAFLLGMACVFLTAAWHFAPQRILAARDLRKLTGRTQGKIVDGWLALDLDPAKASAHSNWQPSSRVSRCAVIEYRGDWGTPRRLAFCGAWFTFDEATVATDPSNLAPGAPFAFRRDANGIVVPEIRLSSAALRWLATHPAGFAWPDKPPPPVALAALRLALDWPVDDIVLGASRPLPAFPLAFDPRHPESALPAGYVAHQLDDLGGAGAWIGFVVGAALGLPIWFGALGFLLGATPRWAFWAIALLGLATLPWWSEQGPRALRYLNRNWGDVVEIMLDDIGGHDRLFAGDPAEADLAQDERLIWSAGSGTQADTFWRFVARPVRPPVPPRDTTRGAEAKAADEALEALVTAVTARVTALGDTERAALFHRLERDQHGESLHAGIVFLRAAKAAILDPRSSRGLRQAARDFLWAWVLSPDDGQRSNLAAAERSRLHHELLDVPIPEIANMASAHWGTTPAAR